MLRFVVINQHNLFWVFICLMILLSVLKFLLLIYSRICLLGVGEAVSEVDEMVRKEVQ